MHITILTKTNKDNKKDYYLLSASLVLTFCHHDYTVEAVNIAIVQLLEATVYSCVVRLQLAR